MAGNNLIQILRGSASDISSSNQNLLDGQLLYDKTNNRLYIGNGSQPVNDATLIGGMTGPQGERGPTGPTGPAIDMVSYFPHGSFELTEFGVANAERMSYHIALELYLQNSDVSSLYVYVPCNVASSSSQQTYDINTVINWLNQSIQNGIGEYTNTPYYIPCVAEMNPTYAKSKIQPAYLYREGESGPPTPDSYPWYVYY